MALKFLNKKGWHTGSLRNIENVWKAEQKHDAEQKKLEELRKQIHEERERSEFRQIQEAAGLVPRQERLDFLYESGLAVGKGSSEGFKALEAPSSGGVSSSSTAADSSSSKAAVPGALFEDKPQSANDAWRKLHSDPLLLIRQREQEALARIKNNPIRMAMIRNSLESENQRPEVKHEPKKKKKHKHGHNKSKEKDQSKSQSDPEYCSDYEGGHRRRDRSTERQHYNNNVKEGRENEEKKHKRKINHAEEQDLNDNGKHSSMVRSHSKYSSKHSEKHNHSYIYHSGEQKESRNCDRLTSDNYDFRKSNDKHSPKLYSGSKRSNEEKKTDSSTSKQNHSNLDTRHTELHSQRQSQNTWYNNNRRRVPKMTEEEKEAKLREMQMNAELHEEQRCKRLKKATEVDALEAKQAAFSKGKSFLDATMKTVYGMEEGGSSTIEESVRRRTHYSQGHSAHETNAFRR